MEDEHGAKIRQTNLAKMKRQTIFHGMVYLKGLVVVTGGLVVCSSLVIKREEQTDIEMQVERYESLVN